MPLVDYLIARDGPPPRQGLAYDFVLAGDGLFLVSENHSLAVRIPVVTTTVRGLPPIYPSFALKTGLIPQALWEGIVTVARTWAEHGQEVLLVVTYQDGKGYQLAVPPQVTSLTQILYRPNGRTVLQIHSHHRFPAQFSATDDADEHSLCLYGVIGRLDQKNPEVALRVGAYGYFLPIRWESVFTGEKGSFRDIHAEPDEQEGHEGVPH